MNLKIKHIISLGAISVLPIIAISSCSTGEPKPPTSSVEAKIATFNISFATDNDDTENYQRWVDFMSIEKTTQDPLIDKYKQSKETPKQGKATINLTPEEIVLAERIIQIRNVAAIIQKNRPDTLVLNEFNNDGTGSDKTIISNFQKNYLSHGQSLNSIDGGNVQDPIEYPFFETYATNTGLSSGMDLNNDGKINNNPNDAFGFGYYHGHYAIALLSMHEIDKENTRTFQEFKWKDLPNSQIPKVEEIVSSTPPGMKIGDNWFTDEEWNNIRLSSKNHLDVPIKIKKGDTVETINLLISHPTPPVFEIGGTKVNFLRNKGEVDFWTHYINNEPTLYDDKGNKGGIDGTKNKFIILGDLNSDIFNSAKSKEKFNGINGLLNSNLLNSDVATGNSIAISNGGKLEANSKKHPKPESRTSTFGLRVDYSLPSNNLEVLNTGIYWQADGEEGRLLFNDPRIGKYGNGKEVSSDHRFVWTTIKI